MAFRQPSLQRVVQATTVDRVGAAKAALTHQPVAASAEGESRTWVLFSRTGDDSVTTSYLAASGGASGGASGCSVDTHRRSDDDDPAGQSLPFYERFLLAEDDRLSVRHSVQEDFEDDDGAGGGAGVFDHELDSLDDHLADFRGTELRHTAGDPILFPAHDGLGSFHVNRAGTASQVQQQIYKHELVHKTKLSPLRDWDRDGEKEQGENRRGDAERHEVRPVRGDSKMDRVQAWRREQSRLLLEEVQRLARHQQQRQGGAEAATGNQELEIAEGQDMRSVYEDEVEGGAANKEGGQAGEEAEGEEAEGEEEGGEGEETAEYEGFWARMTRRIIKDLMGIDDRLLSILLGETLPDEDEDLWSTATPRRDDDGRHGWQLHLLERVATELGLLVNQPLAQCPSGDSAGRMPTRESTSMRSPPPFTPQPPRSFPQLPPSPALLLAPAPSIGLAGRAAPTATAAVAVFSQDEWERDLDIRLVFRYLRARFGSHARSDAPPAPSPFATVSPEQQQQQGGRAASRTPHSCANQNTASAAAAAAATAAAGRRSARRGSGSSRPCWDFGGSVDGSSRSVAVSVGPVGSWGEV